jgi:DNA-binding NarL/FixJ family response regulator
MSSLSEREAASTFRNPASTTITSNLRSISDRPRLVVGIIAAYPSVRAGLAALIQVDRALTPMAIQPQSLLASAGGPTIANLASIDLIVVEPGDLATELLGNLISLTRAEDVPLLWLGVPASALAHMTEGRSGGMISPDAEAETLVAAVRAVAAGLRVIDGSLGDAAELDRSAAGSAIATEEGGPLSRREREVLGLVAAGLPNKAIARELGISDHTVKFHVSSLLTKLDAGSRTEAVTIATRQGILSL